MQASTRTRSSFELAAKSLSADVLDHVAAHERHLLDAAVGHQPQDLGGGRAGRGGDRRAVHDAVDRLVERRAGEPFTRVHICYRLRPAGRPAELACGVDYLVSADPPHVEVAEAFGDLGRELEAGRDRWLGA